nr:structural protein [Red mite densovirus 1]
MIPRNKKKKKQHLTANWQARPINANLRSSGDSRPESAYEHPTPGHHYLGAGNSLENGPPTDLLDRLAQRHDYQYSRAIQLGDSSHVSKADQDFISGTIQVGTGTAYLAGNAISAKRAYESLFGVTYPSGLRKPTTNRTYGKSATPLLETSKRFALQPTNFEHQFQRVVEKSTYPEYQSISLGPTDESAALQITGTLGKDDDTPVNKALRMASGEAGASTTEAHGGHESNNPVNQIITHPHRPGAFTFRRIFQWTTMAFPFQLSNVHTWMGGEETFTAFKERDLSMYFLPLCALPVDHLLFYMSLAEWQELPPRCHAKKCRVKATPIGYRMPFATNSANSVWANSELIIQLMSSVGIDRQFATIEGPIVFNGMKPQGYHPPAEHDNDGTWFVKEGYHDSAFTLSPMHFNRYTTIASKEYPHVSKYYNIFNYPDCKGVPLLNYDYTFGCAPITSLEDAMARVVNPDTNIPMGHTNVMFSEQSAGGRQYATPGRRDNRIEVSPFMKIEKSNWMTYHSDEYHVGKTQPGAYIGCMPVRTTGYTVSNQEIQYAEVIVQWVIETELEVSWDSEHGSEHPGSYRILLSYLNDPNIRLTHATQTRFIVGGKQCTLAHTSNDILGHGDSVTKKRKQDQ